MSHLPKDASGQLKKLSKVGLKFLLISVSEKIISEAFEGLPFGGVAKTAFDFRLNHIEGI